MKVPHVLAAAVVLATVAAAPTARAQAATGPSASGPTILAASSAVRSPVRTNPNVPEALDLRQRLPRAETLMIIGGAIFLAGAIIGDDPGTVIMITGAAFGIYGLYLYLQ